MRTTATAVPASGTLYVASKTQVNAFALDASGSALPDRTITPHPNQPSAIDAIATAADGTLDILQDVTSNGKTSCQIVVESATLNGTGPKLAQYACDATAAGGTMGIGIARNPAGGFDVAYANVASSYDSVRRYGPGGIVIGTLGLSQNGHAALVVDAGGHDYVDRYDSWISKYKANAVGAVAPSQAFAIHTQPQAMAVGPDRTLYVATVDGNGLPVVVAIPVNTTTPTRSIGPFSGGSVAALAVDSQNQLYVGLNYRVYPGSSLVNVYPTDASGTSQPLRSLSGPLPAGSPFITGIAISD